MKKEKWIKPTIIIVVVLALLISAGIWFYDLAFGGTLKLTVTDVTDALNACKVPLIIAGVLTIIAVILALISFKLKKPLKNLVRVQSPVALLLAVMVAINGFCNIEYSVVNSVFSGSVGMSEETYDASKKLALQIAEEGIVLLKNEEKALPLSSDISKINVFGWSSIHPIYGGTGSGAMSEEQCISLIQGLENAGYEVNSKLQDFYHDFRDERPHGSLLLREIGQTKGDWTVPEPTIEEYEEAGIFEQAKEFSDTAMIFIARSGGEAGDLPMNITASGEENRQFGKLAESYDFTVQEDDIDPQKSYLELSNREEKMVDKVAKEFENVIVVINSSNTMELGWLEKYDNIKAALVVSGPGEVGFQALGKILKGDVNPSGHLTDTYVYDLYNTPVSKNYGSFMYDNYAKVTGGEKNISMFVNYVEGIYVGYKFYETAAKEGLINYEKTVQYPFGYGLSYTEFESEIAKVEDNGEKISLQVNVKNIGDTAGKYTAEIYYTPPYYNGGIEKASMNLMQFAKTKLLEPGEEQTLQIEFLYEDMASYDSSCIKSEEGAYVLEEGEYEISLCSDSHTVLDSYKTTVDRDIIYDESNDGKRSSDKKTAVNQLKFAEGDVEYLSRTDQFSNYETATAAPKDFSLSEEALADYRSAYTFDMANFQQGDEQMPVTGADNNLKLKDLQGLDYEDGKWEKLLDQLTAEEMFNLAANGGYHTIALESIGLANTEDADGPTGIHSNYNEGAGINYPSAVMLANTWNQELAKQKGERIGKEAKELGITGWYGPGMNIHRSAFSGRNFEYYSEDGTLSALMAGNEVGGATEQGLIVYMKHFALNDQENHREKGLCTWSTEQAIREIYLKPFEESVKAGKATGTMTSMNSIGTQWTGCSDALLMNVLRDEWGFQGSVITDAYMGMYQMSADYAIRTGGTKILAFSVTDDFFSELDSANTVNALRNAAHGTLYALANSNAMAKDVSTPIWVFCLIGVDILLAAWVVYEEIMAIKKYKKSDK